MLNDVSYNLPYPTGSYVFAEEETKKFCESNIKRSRNT